MNPQISIIVPVYKVEPYLNKCIDSILTQTFTDFELILVEDGSPDRCGEICDEYAKKDNRIIVIHKENGGLSSARNAGLDIAKGEYIGFVDSDDYIEKDMYELLYQACIENKCEIANCTSTIYFPDKTVVNGSGQVFIHSKQEAMEQMLWGIYYDEVVWVKLFKRDIIADIRFPVGRIYEDTSFTYRVIDKCTRYCFIGKTKYHYIKHEGSIMNNAKKVVKLDALDAYEEMLEFLVDKYPHLKKLVILKLTNTTMSLLNMICEKENFNNYTEEYKKLTKTLNKYFKSTIKLEQYPNTVKILLLATRINPYLYRHLMNNYVKEKRNEKGTA